MGFRFQRRLKILPGISLNIGKSGVSTSLGVRGAHVTIGRGKVRTTVGLPGTGISYTETARVDEQATARPLQPGSTDTRGGAGGTIAGIVLVIVIGLVLWLAAR